MISRVLISRMPKVFVRLPVQLWRFCHFNLQASTTACPNYSMSSHALLDQTLLSPTTYHPP